MERLSYSEAEQVEQLVAMGFQQTQSIEALKRFSGNAEHAINWICSNGAPDDDVPPLIDSDIAVEPPPSYDPVWNGNLPAIERKSTSHHPTSPVLGTSTVVDLTGDSPPPLLPLRLVGPAPFEDAEIQRVIQASVQSSGLDVPTEEDEMTKAMEASLVSLVEVDAGAVDTVLGWRKPEERIREDMSSPPILRSLSPHLSSLAAYLQCLYAQPTWRKAIFAFRPPNDVPEGRTSYDGYWRGADCEAAARSSGLVAAVRRIVALQRLFVLMQETRRSFLHVTEISAALQIRESDYKFTGTWLGAIGALHEQLVSDYMECENARLGMVIISNIEVSEDEIALKKEAIAQLFTATGRSVSNDKYISGPLRPSFEEVEASSVFDLEVFLDLAEGDTLTAALDRSLVSETSLELLARAPETLAFRFNRSSTAIASLEGFGQGLRKKKPFELEEEIWLDRFMIRNRKEVAEGRQQISELKKEREGIEERRAKLRLTRDGKDAVELLSATLEYLKQATTEDAHRAASQQRLASQYELILARMVEKIAEYDESLRKLDALINAVFEKPSMKNVGPYRLSAFLMWTGLNGRSNVWSIVRDDANKWRRIRDLEKEEVTLEQALSDSTGLQMNAGTMMAFYQSFGKPFEQPEIPQFVQAMALKDNFDFATELPIEIAASWNLPPLDERYSVDVDMSRLPRDRANARIDAIVPDSPKDTSPYFTPALSVPDEDHIPDSDTDSQVVAASMAMDAREDLPSRADETDASMEDGEEELRLRGGAEGGESDEEYDDEGEEEDEVELGLLKAMPENWDVDLGVGKVGGVPRWVDPASPLSFDDVACGMCGEPMSFLLQINSPDDGRPYAASRALYIFTCRTTDCHSSKVWRVQMPSPNAFFPHTIESEGRRKQLGAALDPTTGLAGSLVTGKTARAALPEWEVVSEPEPWEDSYLSDPVESPDEDDPEGEDAAEPDTSTGVDAPFLRFQERVQRLPEQVLRFYRLPGVEHPEPLWISSTKVLPTQVPACPLCGSARDIEFQVLSTLLTYLDDYDLQLDSMLVYTCLQNCPIPPRPGGGVSGWAEEHVVLQTFAPVGVVFKGPQ